MKGNPMKLVRNVHAITLVTVIALVGVIVLTALHDNVPDMLAFVVVTGLGALAGVTVPSAPPASKETP